MSDNSAVNKDLLDKVDRLLNEGQPTNVELLDDLANTIPRANPAFQQQLENRLIDQLQVSSEMRKKDMTYQTYPMPQKWTWIPRPRVAVPPLTPLFHNAFCGPA